MALPANYDTETITGTYLNLDGTPAAGTVTFTPQITGFMVDTGAKVTILPTPILAKLDANGSFTTQLPATDDPDVAPNGFTYTVGESLSAGNRTYSIAVKSGTGPIDLALTAPSVPVSASVQLVRSVNGILPDSTGNVAVAGSGGSGAVSSVNGKTGAVVLAASDVGALTQTIADGRYDTLGAAAAKYTKPTTGIPSSDLDSATQTAITEAGTAVQSVNGLTGTAITITAASINASPGLTPTTVKTAAYNAAAGDYIPVDASTASVTVTLPSAPADKTRIAVQVIALTNPNTVTVTAAGSDVLNKAFGATSMVLASVNQGVILQYATATKIWYVEQGLPGAAGTTGPAGVRGTEWFSGAGAPGTVAGAAAGDWYLDTNNGDIYTAS